MSSERAEAQSSQGCNSDSGYNPEWLLQALLQLHMLEDKQQETSGKDKEGTRVLTSAPPQSPHVCTVVMSAFQAGAEEGLLPAFTCCI